MTRPEIIRADSIDLQDADAPSAKDHTRTEASESSSSSLGAHQAETLREVAQETAAENSRSPRISWTNGNPDQQSYETDDLVASVANELAETSAAKNMQAQQHPSTSQDSLAVAQNGGLSTDESDADGDTDESMDDDMMDKISSSPSIEDEDIDFDFVYALHTFVATVEGQANATKGDTMVLLDDSNSYWWLVRVAKDNSIGYLPAEHIETPTERLARLNKHRNIDLSATMLGDQAGKESKSAFRSALRGKKKKTVVFAEPTYVDYSDFADFSSDEEDAEELLGTQQDGARQEQKAAATEQAQKAASDDSIDESAKVEPLKPRAPKEVKLAEPVIKEVVDEDETRRSSVQFFEAKPEGPSRSRNGTVRNTDSFFKDETVETKKITLTPNLLRDDTAPRSSNDSKELKQRASLDKMEKLERELQPDKKDDKKKKEKKPSAIRSFFSRKDKKKTSNDDDDDSLGKRSMDTVNEDHDDESVQDSPQRGEELDPRTCRVHCV
ncbi:Tip elongation aberrant protein Tea4 like [Verticillium longisporum]|nr:Tip elongation aberrant protein Tea4 like [Verticillium longisporum]